MGFFVPLENFYSYGDVTNTGEGLQILNDLCSTLKTIEQYRLIVYNGHLRGPVTLTPMAE